ncbi:MAG: HIT domain-containing protein [Planctomycetaceae bacterium]|jgi:UDPglucose--hexose-1-phosphate uridylyltransferase|nr:HIT domain-containing protein [Planctomycetaceae bacterium]
MPEYRRDPITGRTVIIAAERAERPHQFDIVSDGTSPAANFVCPFCEGSEDQTTPEVAAFRTEGTQPDSPGWQVRAVPNKYPAVNGTLGQHEVIIDTPRHILSVSEMTEDEVVNMFRMYQECIKRIRNNGQWVFVQIFKNVGAAAGASIPHSHSQMIALPFVPEFNRFGGEGTAAKQLEDELQQRVRIVGETELSAALCPFASRFAGEVEVYPKRHCTSFDELNTGELRNFALLVRRVITRMEQNITHHQGRLAYNFVLHTEPFTAGQAPPLTFLSIFPSLARAAGFEWGTGLHINPIPPEIAAEKLRLV